MNRVVTLLPEPFQQQHANHPARRQVAALVAALFSPNGPEPALTVGYGATALGGLFVVGLLVASKCGGRL